MNTLPKLMLFDLDDTLCDHDGSLRVRLRASFREALPEKFPEDKLADLVERSIERSVFGTEHFFEILGLVGVQDHDRVQAAINIYVADRYRGLKLFDEAVSVVNAIRSQTSIGMITNGPSKIQRDKIELLGIGPLFPFILVSEEQGVWKPDPEIFRRALEKGCARPDEAVYVGDNQAHDIGGANASGLTSVWVNRRSESWEHGDPPDHTITDLRDLFDIFRFDPDPSADR